MKTHSMESPQAFLDASRLSSNPTDRVRINAVIKYHLWTLTIHCVSPLSTIVLKQLMVSTCYNVKVRLLYRSLQGLTIILNTQLNGKYHRGMTSHLCKFS